MTSKAAKGIIELGPVRKGFRLKLDKRPESNIDHALFRAIIFTFKNLNPHFLHVKKHFNTLNCLIIFLQIHVSIAIFNANVI